MATVLTAAQVAELEQKIRDIPDPEIPVISIDDLGIVRDISVDADGGLVRVTITPTYSGCPAVQAISDHISWTVRQQGLEAEVDTTLSPAWTTDWMSEKGRESLRRFGIAPPTGTRPAGPVAVGLSVRQVACPTCGSLETEELSRFGGTACKALRRCLTCREPFEEFKAI
ncbi:1,2-phenylacetyl-CoA epoxidase subunit PaaD [Ornithinimicrobium ciconiae]|uniref:1,2-phenylacetyl-CoA epoxidase subunit PaaD n=1 Tax=Ornithinimicrobium ciconiae TaxID=2594265 RepID=UPI002AA29FB4|nr:1,2-phenylacetyl-CoA epoxidase subunit PaaD [Ornithinimicrobium ciconiae]